MCTTIGNDIPGDTQEAPSPKLMSNYRTSSEMIKATVGRTPTLNYRTYGVPTIRSDLPAPRIKRVSDHTVSSIYSIELCVYTHLHACNPIRANHIIVRSGVKLVSTPVLLIVAQNFTLVQDALPNAQ